MRALVALTALGALAGAAWRVRYPLAAGLLVVACSHARAALPVRTDGETVTFVNDSPEPTTVFITIPARSELRVRTVIRHR